MTEKNNRVEVFFDDEELAVLEELSTGVKWSVEKIVYDTVARAHFSEEAKKRHAAWNPLIWNPTRIAIGTGHGLANPVNGARRQ